MDYYLSTYQCWSTSKDLHIPAGCQEDLLGAMNDRDGGREREREREKERERERETLCYQHDLIIYIYIYAVLFINTAIPICHKNLIFF